MGKTREQKRAQLRRERKKAILKREKASRTNSPKKRGRPSKMVPQSDDITSKMWKRGRPQKVSKGDIRLQKRQREAER